MCIYCRGGRFTRWLGFMLDVFKSALSLWWLLICPCLMMPTFLEYLSSTDLLLRCLSWRHFGTMLNITQHDTHVSITNPIDTGVLSFGRSLSNMQTCLIYLLFFLSQNAFMSFWFAISQVFWCWKMLSVFLPLSMSLKCVFFAILFWLQVLLCILFTSVSCVCKFQRTALLIAHTPSHDPVNLLSLSTHIYIHTYIIYILCIIYNIHLYIYNHLYTALHGKEWESRGSKHHQWVCVCVCVSVCGWKLKAHDSLHDSLKHSKQLKARF